MTGRLVRLRTNGTQFQQHGVSSDALLTHKEKSCPTMPMKPEHSSSLQLRIARPVSDLARASTMYCTGLAYRYWQVLTRLVSGTKGSSQSSFRLRPSDSLREPASSRLCRQSA